MKRHIQYRYKFYNYKYDLGESSFIYIFIIRIIIDFSAFSMEYREVESGLADHEARPSLQSVC